MANLLPRSATAARLSQPPPEWSFPPQHRRSLPVAQLTTVESTKAVTWKDFDQLKFVAPLSPDHTCQICMKVLRGPQATECCGQHYCKSCLETWFVQSQQGNICPHCRQVNFRYILYKPLQRKIDELMVYCPNHGKGQGCPNTMKLKDLVSHMSTTNPSGCDYITIMCLNKCGSTYYRKNEANHLNNKCSKRKVACQYCNIEVTYDSLHNHHSLCDNYPLSCPRKCQEKSFRRAELKKHEDECPNMPVKCPFYEAGCEYKLTRKDLKSHVENNVVAHTTKSMTFFKNEIDELKSKVSRAAVKIIQATNQLQNTSGHQPHVMRSLQSALLLLTDPQLDFQKDIAFCFPQDDIKVWRTLPFVVPLGHKFMVEISQDTFHTCASLFLLKGDQLKSQAKMDKGIKKSLYDHAPKQGLLNLPPSSPPLFKSQPKMGKDIKISLYDHAPKQGSLNLPPTSTFSSPPGSLFKSQPKMDKDVKISLYGLVPKQGSLNPPPIRFAEPPPGPLPFEGYQLKSQPKMDRDSLYDYAPKQGSLNPPPGLGTPTLPFEPPPAEDVMFEFDEAIDPCQEAQREVKKIIYTKAINSVKCIKVSLIHQTIQLTRKQDISNQLPQSSQVACSAVVQWQCAHCNARLADIPHAAIIICMQCRESHTD